MERLRGGEIDDGWYEPSAELAPVFERFEREEADGLRALAVYVLAHAAFEDEDVWLEQPDKTYLETWGPVR
jgi:hypothetical protein